MAFALTTFRARGLEIMGSQPDRAIQQIVMTAIGLATDVALDLGTDAGTFWTAALADATNGALATAALPILTNIVANAQAMSRWFISEIIDRLQAASASGTSYTVTIDHLRPTLAFAASNGLTSYTIILEYVLKAGILPIEANYGVAGA